MNPRHAIAEALAAALPDWTVHPAPRLVPGARTAIVAPGVPYIMRDAWCDAQYALEVGLYWSAEDPDGHDLDALDAQAVEDVWPALEAVQGVTDVRYASVRIVTVGDATLLLGVFDLTMYATRN